ncbi:transcriptional regulator, LysR family [Serinicoccus hydrothermalis]|uniref:Transcriptional regulator, LysR family n=1 Tax=Serinicoccus hydrothermalis TaxID=1758689 RepID=A0A1B1N7S4_9MICO|nr:LysR family transcriptional regulator ArgP [Serinicoccus hydrothermalis]ANS77483.1 transcriptional regulator, LysR family [Serinicoccus hydrothermalis]
MNLDPAGLETLACVVREGSFDRAARRLSITPSAVSQRIRALERGLGRVVVTRSKPVVPTPAGEVLLRLAGHWEVLVGDALAELVPEAEGSAYPSVSVVVNADSLATWLLPALARAQEELGVVLDLVREDEEYASERVRAGTALAAVTADPTPVPGCRITPLGSLRYVACCTPAFHGRWFADGVRAAALDAAPVLRFDDKDRMQHRVARRWARREVHPPAHVVGSSHGFAEAVRLGMGWGMIPVEWAEPWLAAGELVELGPRPSMDVPLHWLSARLASRTLDVLTRCVTEQAATALHRRR